jgi:hypothetical protein
VAGAVGHVPEVGGTENLPPGMGMCLISLCKHIHVLLHLINVMRVCLYFYDHLIFQVCHTCVFAPVLGNMLMKIGIFLITSCFRHVSL